MQNNAEPYHQKEPLIDKLPCGLLSFSPEGKIMTINSIMATWLGKEPDALVEQNFRSLLDRPSMLYYNLVVDPLLNMRGQANEFSLKFVCGEGYFDALLNVQAHHAPNGELSILTAAVFKVADRKKYETELLLEKRNAEKQRLLAEEEKRKSDFLFSSMPNQVWTTNPKGTVINMNENAKTYFKNLHHISNNAFPAIDKDDRYIAITQWRACLTSGRKFERELRLCSTNSTPEWFLVRAEPYYHTDGEIEMWFCTAVNINRKKLLELANQQEMKENLFSAYQSLEERSELLVEIATSQSHMVRRPLANLLGLAELMKQEEDPKTLALLLEKLIESAAELDDMVRQISEKTIV